LIPHKVGDFTQEYHVETEKEALIIDNMSNLITRWDNILPQYHRAEHVVVLANQDTYGAAEIFLRVVKGMEGVTIMGSPSTSLRWVAVGVVFIK
jgi:C-terminal processing protease CtpA/Prc